MRPLLAHRIPGHPEHFYYRASGGFWLHHLSGGFVRLFATRADMRRYFEETPCEPSTKILSLLVS